MIARAGSPATSSRSAKRSPAKAGDRGEAPAKGLLRTLDPEIVGAAALIGDHTPVVVARGSVVGDVFVRGGTRAARDPRPAAAIPTIELEVEVGIARAAQPGLVTAAGGGLVIATVGLNLRRARAGERAGILGAARARIATAATARGIGPVHAQADVAVGAVAADHDVPGTRLRACEAAAFVTVAAIGTAVVSAGRGRLTEADIEVGIAGAAGHIDHQVGRTRGNGEVEARLAARRARDGDGLTLVERRAAGTTATAAAATAAVTSKQRIHEEVRRTRADAGELALRGGGINRVARGRRGRTRIGREIKRGHAGHVRRGHRGSRDGVGRAVARVPGRRDVGTRREDVHAAPQLEKEERASVLVVEPTVMALATRAGETLQASWFRCQRPPPP